MQGHFCFKLTLIPVCFRLITITVILKIMKDYNPNKTQLCITAAATSSKSSSKQLSNEPIDVVSKSRTLKVMRSALAGIPILTPKWIDACLKDGCVIAPTGNMCIRTLPRKHTCGGTTKPEDEATEHFGAAKYAASFQQASTFHHLLNGVSVLLCGSSASAGMTKDLKVLLQQAGASIVSSISMANKQLTDMSKKGQLKPFVFLCDDSASDKSCGISDALFKQAKKLLEKAHDNAEGKESPVMCVHFSWLFDSISCATPMKAGAYKPMAPRSRALWNLTTGDTNTSDNRKESQIY